MQIKVFMFLIVTLFLCHSCKKENNPPNLHFDSDAFGCQSFTVFKTNNSDGAVAVLGNRNNLHLSTSEQTFDLSKTNNDLVVQVKQVDGNPKTCYCYDVSGVEGNIESYWYSVAGEVTVKITHDSIAFDLSDPLYKINVSTKNVKCKNKNGKVINLKDLEFNDVLVGWLPG